MNFSNYRFTLDLHSLHSQTSIPVMLGDTGITWHINLCDGGKPYLIAEGCLAKISIKRPTGTYHEAFCEIRGNATIVYPFAQETCVAVGLHNCEITLYGVDGNILGTPRFSMIVGDRVIKRDDITLTDEDRTIVDAMVVEEAKRQAAEEGRVARFEQTIEDMKESFRNSAVHIGPEAPENGETIWLDTNEEEKSEIGVVAKVGQVLAVKSIGPDGKPAEYYGVDLPKVPTPNMEANEGEEGYVEGRTHYVDKDGIVHKLDNKYINAAWMATKEENGGTIEWWQDLAFTSAYFSLNPHWYPDVGFDWDIYWNNTKYTCPLVTSAGECFLGNRSLLGSEYPDTGEPFLFYGYALTNKDPEIVALKKKTETAETVNVVITTKHEVVYNTLPKAYLPKDVALKSDIPEHDSGADIDAHNESAEAHMDIRVRLDAIKVPTKLSELSGDSTHRTVTDSEKSAWSGKENAGVAAGLVNAHNVGGDAHNDIRLLIEGLNTRLNAVANSSDVNLDQLAELVTYIKANRSLIEQVTTNKVSVSDIINNLTTNVSNKPLSAAQGVALKALIDAITVPTKLSQLADDASHRTVTDEEKEKWNVLEEVEAYTANTNIVIAQQSVSSGMWDNRKMDIYPGTVYAVYINGEVYFCTAHEYDGGVYLGNITLMDSSATDPHNNEPFCVYWAGGSATGGFFYKDSTLSNSVTLKVTGAAVTTEHKLPKEYLPDDVAMKSDIPEGGGVTSWNDLTDKPFSEGAGELWFTYTATFATDAAAKNGVLAKDAMGNTLSWLEVNGELLKVHKEQEGMTVGWYDADGNKWVTSTFAGVYVIAQTAGTYTYKFYAPSDELMLEPKYLPPNLAKKSDIPEGGSDANIDVVASVGQTIVVEEVDADGKPTKWKAAEFQERTHWSDFIEVQPSTTITPFYYEALGVPMGQMSNFDIVIGNKYKVIFDGVEYVCEAFIASMAGMSAPAFGNTAVAGGANTGEPFAIFKMAGDEWTTAIFFDMNPHTVQVFTETATPIPQKYLGNALPYYLDVTGDGTEDDPYVCSARVEDVVNALKNGRSVVMRQTANYNGSLAMVMYHTCMYAYTQTIGDVADAGWAQFGSYSTMGRKGFNLIPKEDGTYEVDALKL